MLARCTASARMEDFVQGGTRRRIERRGEKGRAGLYIRCLQRRRRLEELEDEALVIEYVWPRDGFRRLDFLHDGRLHDD